MRSEREKNGEEAGGQVDKDRISVVEVKSLGGEEKKNETTVTKK